MTTSMDLASNKAIVRRYVEEVQNQHRVEALETIFAEDFIDHMDMFDGLFQGIEGLKQGYREILKAFPDFSAVIHAQVAENDGW